MLFVFTHWGGVGEDGEGFRGSLSVWGGGGGGGASPVLP